ncbi:MAG TPA: sigma-54 dependent transcriptional regulator [Gemmatimonadales bacterium]|nr:sigma-54 dependent transcriptional regulator [Gemmatimonadales bacterium]
MPSRDTVGDAPGVTEEPEPALRPRVLLVEDDLGSRAVLLRALESVPYEVDAVGTGEEGLRCIGAQVYDLALFDLNLPGLDGMSLLSAATAQQPDAQFIMITGDASVETAIEAMRLGAYDYLRKPLHVPELLVVLERALEERERRREVARLRRKVEREGMPTIIGQAPAMKRMHDLIERVAPSRATVLITGETGTGKELVAQTIHALSDRARKPFVTVQCSALSESLLESELFGHMKGSFTGAIGTRRGLFEEAADGTLFLDEVATLSPTIQVKLLRTLQERRVQRVGANQPIPIAFRLIAATNADLSTEVAQGRFREDLFYRLNVFPIKVPPLRERRSDIPLLASFFCVRAAERNGVLSPELSAAVVTKMTAYDWPGNVRELENFIERAVIMYGGSRAVPVDAAQWARDAGPIPSAVAEQWTLERLEREFILAVLGAKDGNVAESAVALGIDRRTLFRKLRRYREGGLIDPALPSDEPEPLS